MSQTWTVMLEIPADSDLEDAGETVELDVGEEQSVLSAARAAGVWLPADCQQGWCTTCAAELLDGEVDQSTARRTYEEDGDYVLLCRAKPRSDLRLKVDQMQALLEQRAEHDLPPGRSKVSDD